MPRPEQDTFAFFVKIAAVVVLAGLVGGFLLLSGNGGGADDVAVTNPAVPTITDAGGSGPDTSESPQPPPPPATVVAPAVGTQTAVIAVKPKPKPRPGRDTRFGRIGKPCPQQGAITFTKRYEPLVCRDGRWDRIF